MPELAEVESYRQVWHAGLRSHVTAVELHARARVFRCCDTARMVKNLTGATFLRTHSHGKQMMFEFSGGAWLAIHLGMTGELKSEPPDHAATRHDHLVLRQRQRALVFTDPRMFGRVRFDLSRKQPPEWWRELPPAILSRQSTSGRVAAFLARRRRSPIKAALLDQSLFPGIGNWMADEVLWQARIHPRTPCEKLDSPDIHRVWRTARSVSRKAILILATQRRDLPASWLFQHRWSIDRDCPHCGSGLRREDIAGRTTCWCPKCQRA